MASEILYLGEKLPVFHLGYLTLTNGRNITVLEKHGGTGLKEYSVRSPARILYILKEWHYSAH